ncbi:MAG: hypothetical protein ACYC61_31535, partial [Isosphaeraceae bacterium]
MTLVTRVSVAFLVALALALGGFSAALYILAGKSLRIALDRELEAVLDRFPERPAQGGRVSWALFDDSGRRFGFGPVAVDPRPTLLDGRDLGPIAVDSPTTLTGPDGRRWRVLARPLGVGRRRRG